ncbi:helix-turn-helix transcriptional regulator [Streptomyces sp. NPDC052114]|uniref:helix-turn-helix domain-containing protein n=1 Tax=unclassified Streptomyces TaxID=2593676 RepID=UPI003417A9AB
MASLAELLRELKERSGLSYGVLAKRLHMSTSTLHRYCNGDAVPTEFAPVERLARLCKATPEELVEVHRRWILADAARGRKAEPEPRPAAQPDARPDAQPDARAAAHQDPSGHPDQAPGREPGQEPSQDQGQGQGQDQSQDQDQVVVLSRRPAVGKKRALVLAAAVTAVVGLGSLALAMNGGGDGDKRDTGAAASPDAGASPDDRPADDKGKDKGKDDKDKGKDDDKKNGPSASPSRKGDASPDAPRGGGKGPTSDGGTGDDVLDQPLTARTRPYAFDDPCLQDFLVNRKDDEVPQPPAAQDAAGWVGDLGAVSAGHQYIEITVQGLGKDTVVLQDMNVRVQSTSAPLAWNKFQMATGCGGTVNTKSFSVDLDDGSPRATPKAGQRDFPYKVSENDPEVFYVRANTDLHDVRWYLELEWSSGKRHNVLRIDDQGKPFRTSGAEGRRTYGWPPGYDKWVEQPTG